MLKRLYKWAENNYRISCVYHKLRLTLEARKPATPVIVYQMGKVGSTAIVEGLHNSSRNTPIFHVHFLAKPRIDDAYYRLRKLRTKFNANTWCLYESEFVRRYVIGAKNPSKIKLITLFREPIARNISSFFYNIDKYVPAFNTFDIEDPISIKKLEKLYLNNFVEHEYAIQWFSDELEATFGINVFESKFNTQKGYVIIKDAHTEVLVIKLEKLKDCALNSIEEFLGIKDFTLHKANTSEEQPYNEFYKKFLKEAKLPVSYIDKMYSSQFMKHFYSTEEINQFREKWIST
ncbi:hypothetical protein MNBD_GAMMA16-1662 [hydrothermal vent metagenome]|uniref:Capsular polysaccharide synthesis enzyme CpsE n=1 Tax=hydrothermal vent metagenome TaxID=652676 RepID=A0A3B0Z8R4_9ZZZZ